MIEIQFARSFASIASFPSVSLPDFTLITGLNGSGKTHFLRALDHGRLTIKGVSTPKAEVRMLDWNSMVPKNQTEFRGQVLEDQRNQLKSDLISTRDSFRSRMESRLRSAGLSTELAWNLDELVEAKEERARELLTVDVLPGQARLRLNEIVNSLTEQEHSRIIRERRDFAKVVDQLEQDSGKPLYMISDKEIEYNIPTAWGVSDLFEQSFARVFVAYRNEHLRNRLELLRLHEGASDARALDSEAFALKYGVPPWDFLDEIMQSAGLDFEVNKPDLTSYADYHPTLTKKSTDQRVPFDSLSSGEKVLMSFATCLYHAGDQRQTVTFPKVLLLDEVDAPLHPSMSRTLIQAVKDTLVKKFEIKVIATTHSPSTVAMAAEEDVFVMRDGEPGVFKTSKDAALKILTSGVPTLSLSFEGRRQVFVESQKDAAIYDKVYQCLRPFLDSERSLSFLATGTRSGSGDQGTGCDQVRTITKLLREAGNNSVYGVIDWDGVNCSNEYLKVLAMGKRDGLENTLLDPVLLVLTLHKFHRERLSELLLSSDVSFSDLISMCARDWQPVVDRVQQLILDLDPNDFQRTQAEYMGGLKLELSEQFLTIDDHELERQMLAKLPELHHLDKRFHGLPSFMASQVIWDAPELVPSAFGELFNDLLSD